MGLFIELLQVSLGTRDKLSWVPSDVEWLSVLDESKRQTVVGVMLCGIECLPRWQLPSNLIFLQWIGHVQMLESTYVMHCKRAKELTDRFLSVGYRSCVLKGLSAAQRYPIPSRRHCGDIDLWVDGRRMELMAWLQTQCEIGLVTWHHVDAKVFEDVSTEIHFHPSWFYNPFNNARLQTWFKHQAAVHFFRGETTNGYETTNASFDAVYQLTHVLHHLLEEGVGVRHIVDYYYVLHEIVGQDHNELFKTIKKMGMGNFCGAMMYVLREMCGASEELLLCEPNEKEGRWLLQEIRDSGNFGHQRVRTELKRNSVWRYAVMVRHYPGEALWMVPWKVWHWCWRRC